MKQFILFTLLSFTGHTMFSQGCSEIFISEYCEGSGNNKGLEFYNPTDSPIDLGPYEIQRWANGEGYEADHTTDLQGTIPAYGTWVLINGQTEDIDLGGGNISPACDPLLQDYADQLDGSYPAPTYMNGDDALVLIKNSNLPVDIFGKPLEDPGVAWTNNADAGYTDADGGAWLTANKTLRRKFDVTIGVMAPPLEFNTFMEWDTLSSETWDGLGSHFCACDPNSINEVKEEIEFSLFPNPSLDGNVNVSSSVDVQKIEVFNQTGQLVGVKEFFDNSKTVSFQTENLNKGIYLVNVYLANRTTFSKQVVFK